MLITLTSQRVKWMVPCIMCNLRKQHGVLDNLASYYFLEIVFSFKLVLSPANRHFKLIIKRSI